MARRSWAVAQIRVVVSHGLMAPDVARFRPDDPLTRGALAALVAGLTGRTPEAVFNPAAPVTMAGLDAKLVRGLSLGPTYNHPAADDDLELRPADTATRAEAGYSAARILRFGGGEIPAVQAAAASFTLPVFTPWQQRVLTTAFSFVGFPYVWAGTRERAEAP